MGDAAKTLLHELVDRLPAAKVGRIQRVLENEMREDTNAETDKDGRSPLEKAQALGAVGCVGGGVNDPTDVATNPQHMADFGR